MIKWYVRDKRINERGNAVFDLYRETVSGFKHHQATIEINSLAGNGIKVLLGALTPQGKERVWNAIRLYEGVGQ